MAQPTPITTMDPLPPFRPHLGPSLAPTPVVPPLTLYPLSRPPASSPPPPPVRPPLSPPAGYSRSLHACPAAYPRMYEGTFSRESYPFSTIPANESKEARAARIEKDKVTCAMQQREAVKTEGAGWATNSGPGVWMSVERWRRDELVEGGATLVMLHANGMLKEDYHPLVRALFASTPTAQFGTRDPLGAASSVVVNQIFLLDDSMQGMSVDLNAGRLAAMHSWGESARDLLNFLRHCMPAADENASWGLEWRAERAPQPVFAVGHSLGGNVSVQAASLSPELFEGLLLVEPMTQPTGSNNAPKSGFFIQSLTLKRRDKWPSLAVAREVMRNNPMFSKFPDDVFAMWLSHGVVPTSKGGGEVTLTTPSWSEAAGFSDPHSPQRGWDLLPTVKVPIGFVIAENASWMGGDAIAREMTSRPPRARNERVHAGHLAVQENPVEVGEALGRFLVSVRSGVWDAAGSRL